MQRYIIDHLKEHTSCRAYREDREAQWQPLSLIAWCYRRDAYEREHGERPWSHKIHADHVEQESLRRAILQLAEVDRLEIRRDARGLHCRLSVAEWQEVLSVDNCSTLSPQEAGGLNAGLAAMLGGQP
jgi:hypothetical protein